MIFNEHSKLVGMHAFLSASQYHWVNYTDEKLEHKFAASVAARRGSALHAFAHDAIKLGIKLPKTPTSINLYVNDTIGFRMTPEQVLFYSENCFSTADGIGFRMNKLRIHDLKTGITQTSQRQLEVYAAIFCLEYGFKPHEIEMEFRIYQSNEARIYDGDPDVIVHIMDRIVQFDKQIKRMRLEAES